ncbi:RING [Musa troglodytarum]|uniref:RING n=1 Tax=Musa troglodytarum TaxID=320322 RepID=A0A9E7EGJ7_9LILI|nr:RING [Musa troglodytarum]
MPCYRHFHGDCILSWLATKNSCPVCRYELLIDDPEYENWRPQSASNAGTTIEQSVIRYGFEMFPEA